MAVILAGGEGERLSILSQERAKPAVPFGGKYRSSTSRSRTASTPDIDDVVVLTQYNPRSLNDHIGLAPVDLDRNRGGVKLLQPYIERGKVAEWYRGTADAVLRNINVIEHDTADIILVPAGDHIYKMDYTPFVAAHRRHRPTSRSRSAASRWPRRPGWDPRPRRERPRHRVAGEAQAAQERPRVDGRLRLLQETLRRWLSEDRVDFGANVIRPCSRRRARLRLSIQRLLAGRRDDPVVLEANMRLLDDDRTSTPTTRTGSSTPAPRNAPAKVGPTAQVHKSLISHGCVISGMVVNSVLSPGVRVDVGAVVRDSIIMFDSVDRSGAVVDRAILDKEVVIGSGAIVGNGPYDDRPNKPNPAASIPASRSSASAR
jgi:glucose-1-phosphate adenylyltransferase